MRRAVRVSPASARTCRGGLKRAGPDGVRASGPGRGRVGVVSRSVLCVGCGRDQGLGAVPADISIPYGLYGRACGFSLGLVVIVKVECQGLQEGEAVWRVTRGCSHAKWAAKVRVGAGAETGDRALPEVEV